MRKALTIIMVFLLGVTVLALVGCGGDTATAKEDLKAADAAYKAMEKDMTDLQTSLTTVLGGALSGNYAAVTPEAVQAAETVVDKVLSETPGVTTAYKKVDSLKGVDDYKAYAEAMQKVVSEQEQLLSEGKDLIGALKPIVSDQAALAAWFQTNSNTFMQLQEASAKVGKAYEDAQQIKKDKKLTW
jgi:hypothetical protein